MTREELEINRAKLTEAIKKLHPENCPYCGGCHRIRVTRLGQPEPMGICCDDIMREVFRLEREFFGEA